jgi:hypothetical protein
MPDDSAGSASTGTASGQPTQQGNDSGSGPGTGGLDAGFDAFVEPQMLDATGTLDTLGNVDSVTSSDGTTVTTTFAASASSVTYDNMPMDTLDLQSATLVSLTPPLGPPANNCEGILSFTLTPTTASVSFSGTDILPATDCATYAATLYSSGVAPAVFQAVPYQNGGYANQVTLTLTP